MRRMIMAGAVAVLSLAMTGAALAQQSQEGAAAEAGQTEQAAPAVPWLPSLITETPQEGFALAVTLSRRGVTTTQPDKDVLFTLRPHYARDADSLPA